MCRSVDGTKILYPTILPSYDADMPECEDMRLVKRDTQNSSLCHIYLVRKEKCKFNMTEEGQNRKPNFDLLCKPKKVHLKLGYK